MNRFRRKSTSGVDKTAQSPKRKPAPSVTGDRSSPDGAGQSRREAERLAPAIPDLPDMDTFRTSLILPELTQRFSLLKDSNGHTISYDKIQEQIEIHRQAGSLTDREARNVLEQLSIADTKPSPAAENDKPFRHDWRQLDKDFQPSGVKTSSQQAQQAALSIASPPSETLLASPFLSATANGGRNGDRSNVSSIIEDGHSPSVASSSSASFHSPMMSTSGWSLPPSSPLVRGGSSGNAMFGGRVATKMELQRSKSSGSLHSSTSRRSASSKKSLTRSKTNAGSGVDKASLKPESTYAATSQSGLGIKNERRISRALDEIEKQLHLEFDSGDDKAATGAGAAPPTTRQDHSPVVAIKSSPRLPGALPPSPNLAGKIRTSAVPLSPPKPRWSPSQNSPKSVSVQAAASPAPKTGSPKRPQRPSYDKSPLSPALSSRSRQFGSSQGFTPGRVEPSPSSSAAPESPAAASFVTGGSRSDAELSTSDHDGPFDLSYGSLAERRRASAFDHNDAQAAETLKDDDNGEEHIVPESPQSTGSSYHPDESDSDVMRARASLAGLQIHGLDMRHVGASQAEQSDSTTAAATDSNLLNVESEPMSRRPSDELLKTINEARPSYGEADLALRDLMLIQERLVRSASSRASQKKQKRGSSAMDRHGSTSRSSLPSTRRRDSVDGKTQAIDGRGSPYRLSQVTGTTSVTGSSPLSASGATPSTNQSDVFEFSSLVTSPVPSSYEEARDQLQRREAPVDDERHDLENGKTIADQSEMATPHAAAIFLPEQPEQYGDNASENSGPSDHQAKPTPAVDENVRVARGPLPPRNPAATQTMLVREVRNQATLATFALRKQGTKSGAHHKKRMNRSQSVSKAVISAPQLVSGTSDIAAVPIANPEIKSPPLNLLPSPALTKKDPDAEQSAKGKGIGSRFRKLLKKQSRDRLGNLNGDEVTPFDVSADASPEQSPPFTPPNQFSSRFDNDMSTPETVDTPQANNMGVTATPTGLARVDEASEQGSPAPGSVNSNQSREHGLSRFVSKLKRGSDRPKRGSESTVQGREGTDVESLNDGVALSRLSSRGNESSVRTLTNQDRMGLGFSVEPESVDGSPSAADSREELAERTAPLQPRRTSTEPTGTNTKHSSVSTSRTMSAPPDQDGTRGSGRHRQTASEVSIDSMQRLREAAEELGLPRDKVEELVNLSYNHSRTSETGHGGSSGSTVAGISESSSDRRREGSSSSRTGSSSTHHARGYSDVSSKRMSSLSGSAHRRQPSYDGAPPTRIARKMPSLHLSTGDRRTSRASSGLQGPVSPSDGSFRSSYYANSVLDLYGSESADGDDRQSKVYEDGGGEVVLAGKKYEEGTPASERDGSQLWSAAVDDMRRQSLHLSVKSDNNSLVFGSRPTSMALSSPDADASTAVDPLTQLLRHHKRNRSSISSSIPSIPSNNTRFPSLYLRDEQRLLELEREGGIADGEKGRFYVRPVLRDSETDVTSPDASVSVEDFSFEREEADRER
ncbi:hypothetical protein ACM66B_004995 [Microbotryomycetes sp. NB124-2]